MTPVGMNSTTVHRLRYATQRGNTGTGDRSANTAIAMARYWTQNGTKSMTSTNQAMSFMPWVISGARCGRYAVADMIRNGRNRNTQPTVAADSWTDASADCRGLIRR